MCTTSGVLSSTTSNQLSREVVDELFIDAKVLWGGKDCIVWLEVVLLEKARSHGLDICRLLLVILIKKK